MEPNIALMHQVVTAQLAAKRQGTHATKTRGEVSGGGKSRTGRRAPAAPARVRPAPPVHRRRRRPRPAAARLQPAHPEEDDRRRAARALSDRARNDRIHAVTELVTGQTPSTKSAKAFLASLTEHKKVLLVIGRADGSAPKRPQPAWRARDLAGPAQHLRRLQRRRRGVQRRGAGRLHRQVRANLDEKEVSA